MLTFIENNSTKSKWLEGMSFNDLPWLILPDLDAKKRAEIMNWARDYNIECCLNGSEEIDDPLPTPAKPVLAIQQWRDELSILEAKKPSVKKKGWFTLPEVDSTELREWNLQCARLEASNPEITWDKQCNTAINHKKTITNWLFIFDTHDDAALFKLTWE